MVKQKYKMKKKSARVIFAQVFHEFFAAVEDTAFNSAYGKIKIVSNFFVLIAVIVHVKSSAEFLIHRINSCLKFFSCQN